MQDLRFTAAVQGQASALVPLLGLIMKLALWEGAGPHCSSDKGNQLVDVLLLRLASKILKLHYDHQSLLPCLGAV
jgi:hypothetical protein